MCLCIYIVCVCMALYCMCACVGVCVPKYLYVCGYPRCRHRMTDCKARTESLKLWAVSGPWKGHGDRKHSELPGWRSLWSPSGPTLMSWEEQVPRGNSRSLTGTLSYEEQNM